MARGIPLPKPEPANPRGPARLFWTRRTSLTARILAVNIIALGLMAGSLFYLDSYRKQLLEERFKLARSEAEISADALAEAPISQRRALLARIGTEQHLRLRLYNGQGELMADSFTIAQPSFRFIDPATEPWFRDAARILDHGMNLVLGSPVIPAYRDPVPDTVRAWPELVGAEKSGLTVVIQRAAPDQTPVINAAAVIGVRGELLLSTRNAPDITQSVRDARQTLAIVLAATLLISIQLSLFLARTIVQPLRTLVRAAVRVRLGRDREVVVPRLPERRDEIGMLARAVSDMTSALRQRIDAVETFAADVAHEIKNPLASLRSALESLEKVGDGDLRQQLTAIAVHDVQRIDRLVTEIADASRIDAELSRTEFMTVDLVSMVRALIGARAARGVNRDCKVTLQTSGPGPWTVPADPARLERVLENLLDNAVSFSPPGGAVLVTVERQTDQLILSVTDDGPGIPPDARDKVFERFHSLRPAEEAFGSHSGLGLAIARTIVEAHDGTLTATDRGGGKPGARLVIRLPVE
jgi:two-component system sensor histidine kinase ChvG